MTWTSAPRAAASDRPRLLRRLAGLLALAVLAVLLLTLVDTVRVTGPDGRAEVELGLPLPWVAQDQSAVDPAYPTDLGVASPWEHPTEVSLPLLALNVLLTALALLVLLAAVRAVLRVVTSRGGRTAGSRRGVTADAP